VLIHGEGVIIVRAGLAGTIERLAWRWLDRSPARIETDAEPVTGFTAASRHFAGTALDPPYCRWRQLALEELDRAGRPWTLVLQSASTAGIVAALDAGLAITVFPEFNLPNSLKALGAAEALPALPDFEFVLRRSRNSSLAADHLAEMMINFFQLSTALRPGDGMNYKQRSHLLLRTRLEA